MARASTIIGASPSPALADVTKALRTAFIRLGLGEGDHVVAATSGGGDSLALALALADAAERAAFSASALCVDHGIRPQAQAECAYVRDLLGGWGLETRVVQARAHRRGGPEAGAREVRLRAYANEAAALLSAGARRVLVCTGHTLDDQAETVLLRLARGAGTRSLAAMDPGLDLPLGPGEWRIVRPFLHLRREVLREALREAGTTWIEDPTNRADGPWRAADGSALRRAAIRDRALPELTRALGMDAAVGLARSAMLARRDAAALEEWADVAFEGAVRVSQGDEVALEVASLVDLPVAVRTRVWRRACREAGCPPGDLKTAQLDAIDALAVRWHGQGPVDLPGHRRVGRISGEGRLVWWRAGDPQSV